MEEFKIGKKILIKFFFLIHFDDGDEMINLFYQQVN